MQSLASDHESRLVESNKIRSQFETALVAAQSQEETINQAKIHRTVAGTGRTLRFGPHCGRHSDKVAE